MSTAYRTTPHHYRDVVGTTVSDSRSGRALTHQQSEHTERAPLRQLRGGREGAPPLPPGRSPRPGSRCGLASDRTGSHGGGRPDDARGALHRGTKARHRSEAAHERRASLQTRFRLTRIHSQPMIHSQLTNRCERRWTPSLQTGVAATMITTPTPTSSCSSSNKQRERAKCLRRVSALSVSSIGYP